MERILELTAVSGELPTEMVGRMAGGAEYKRLSVIEAKNNGLLKVRNKDGMKGYILTAKGRARLLANNPEGFSFFLNGSTESSHPPSSARRRARLHRLAEGYVLMQNAGAEIFRDKKPLVFSPNYCGGEVKAHAYYSSREIKESGQEFVKVKNSRSVGTLVLPDKCYLVYNCGAGMIRWYENAEERMQCEISSYLRRVGACGDNLQIGGIMVAESMDTFTGFLVNKKTQYAFPRDGGSFEHMHWLPNTSKGETIVKFLCDERLDSRFKQALRKNFSPVPSSFPFDVDAMDGTVPVLFAHTFDAARIERFVLSLEYERQLGSVVCFDFQRDLMKEFCSDRVFVKTVSLADVREIYGI